ncbi:hypothetical protein DL96DRAFT_1012529 [Flagelloscypha sp. PMI_526]|nr:hypothetical protein DL96DRAFT_1012529 [Flagelloscypha sp. PMI_526]
MQFTSFFTSLLVAATTVAAAPSKFSGCDLSKAQINFPAEQKALAVPAGKLNYLALGVGVQNYTCSAAGTYASAGAVAELFDISCLYNTPAYSKIPDIAMHVWKSAPSGITIQQVIGLIPNVKVNLGQHYFIPNLAGTGAAQPKWDFTSSGPNAGNANAYVVGAKVANLPAVDTANIDWLQLKNVAGSLATSIYRTDTRLGQPPASCTVGSDPISVKYVSEYWLYDSTL